MLSTKQAAQQLGVTGTRVRALLNAELLDGEKIGRTWIVSEQSVNRRLKNNPAPGHPSKATPNRPIGPPPNEHDIEAAHRLYRECKDVLAGTFNSSFLNHAESKEEEAFFVSVATFFLQERQRQLIEEGVF